MHAERELLVTLVMRVLNPVTFVTSSPWSKNSWKHRTFISGK
jgi:hypothetical protein